MSKKKKPSPFKPVVRQLESLALRAFLAGAGRLPVGCHGPLASAVAGICELLPLRGGVVGANLDIAFGAQPPAERRDFVRAIRRNTVLFALELARLRRATPEEVRAAVEPSYEGKEYADALLDSGRGFLIGCAHIGNWEWLGAWYALTHGKFGVVYKPMHNPDSEAVSQELRGRYGIKIFSTRERVPRALFAHIRAGGVVAILADQDARRAGRFVPFFGRPASTATGLASLAVRLNVPILPGFCLRTAPGRFRVQVYPPLSPDPSADREAEELRLTAAYLARVEDAIRLAPEQYFWWHRRWKTQPQAEAQPEDGETAHFTAEDTEKARNEA